MLELCNSITHKLRNIITLKNQTHEVQVKIFSPLFDTLIAARAGAKKCEETSHLEESERELGRGLRKKRPSKTVYSSSSSLSQEETRRPKPKKKKIDGKKKTVEKITSPPLRIISVVRMIRKIHQAEGQARV